MDDHFTPELGQACFSNGPWQEYPLPRFMERGLMEIAETIAEARGDEGPLTGNWGGESWDSEVFAMRAYCWCDGDQPGHEDGCPPNFEHHRSGVTAAWYKHVGRGASVNVNIGRHDWRAIAAACIADIEARRHHEPGRTHMSTLSEALFKHRRGFRERIRPAFYCTGCDWTAVVVADGRDGNGVTIDDQHRMHLADVLESIVAARVEAARAGCTCGGAE
jgi:hypothetical protein